MQKEQTKFVSSTVFEGMTSIRAILKGRDAAINDRPIEEILFDAEKIKKIGKDVGYLKAVSTKYGFELVETDADELDRITVGTSHGGLVAIAGERTLPYLNSDFLKKKNGFYAMIDGIEDPYNFGYSLRSLYAMGCDGIILSERNWMSAAGVVCRSSAGASELLPIYISTAADSADYFRNLGYKIVCAGIRDSVSSFDADMACPIFLIVGGEKRGISATLLEKADQIVRIDYGRDFGGSLSAASAASMLGYEVMRQNRK